MSISSKYHTSGTRRFQLPGQLRDDLIRMSTATIHEAQGQTGAMHHQIKPIGPGMRFAGPALTVLAAPGDNLVVHFAVAHASQGDVLVIDAQGYLEGGLWGDILSEAALQAKIAGVVVNGAVRDCDAIRECGLPVFALGLSIKGTAKRQSGRLGDDIVCAGALVRNGDVVVGDSDGVVVVRSDRIDDVYAAARKRVEYEEGLRTLLREGRSTIDLLKLHDSLAAVGLI